MSLMVASIEIGTKLAHIVEVQFERKLLFHLREFHHLEIWNDVWVLQSLGNVDYLESVVGVLKSILGVNYMTL